MMTLQTYPRCFQPSRGLLNHIGFPPCTCACWAAFCSSSNDRQIQEEKVVQETKTGLGSSSEETLLHQALGFLITYFDSCFFFMCHLLVISFHELGMLRPYNVNPKVLQLQRWPQMPCIMSLEQSSVSVQCEKIGSERNDHSRTHMC